MSFQAPLFLAGLAVIPIALLALWFWRRGAHYWLLVAVTAMRAQCDWRLYSPALPPLWFSRPASHVA